MTQVHEKRILQIISQTYAFDFKELENIFLEVNSFDSILVMVDIASKNNISLERAFENWRVIK